MKTKLLYILLVVFLFSVSCRDDESILEDQQLEEQNGDSGTNIEVPDWTEATHSVNAEPNYDVVFKQNEVLRIDLKISATNWQTMKNDLVQNIGSGGGRPGIEGLTSFDPVWVSGSFYFNDKEWYEVGIRFKGNSSLQNTYRSGNNKFSFKIDFDQFEDDYPAIENQRFYGFKQLNLKNNYDDKSLMREKVASDLFLDFGLVSPQTAFCEVYVDNGSGSQYFGVYTLVEEVDDTVLESQFGDESGNLYKPDGTAASFASGSFNESEMEKKNNEELEDYSDVYALYTVLNSSDRTSNTEQWKTNLENVLDVDVFLKWLAANTAMQNWDTYGKMTHNYYLYNNPVDGLLCWIPWDNNEALQNGKQGGALSLSLSEVGSGWPLISYLIDVPGYKQKYEAYLQQFVDEVFVPETMVQLYSEYYDLLKEYAYAEVSGFSFLESDSDFDSAVSTLKSHVQSRNNEVASYLQ